MQLFVLGSSQLPGHISLDIPGAAALQSEPEVINPWCGCFLPALNESLTVCPPQESDSGNQTQVLVGDNEPVTLRGWTHQISLPGCSQLSARPRRLHSHRSVPEAGCNLEPG